MNSDKRVAPAGEVQQGVVIVVVRAGKFLMIRRAEGILAGGAWCFVGGGIEPGETQAAAARREFFEELGGIVRPIRKIWEFTRSDGKLLLHWWLATLEEGALRAHAAEVAEYRWCSPEEIRGLPDVLESNLAFLRGEVCRAVLDEA